MLMLLYLVCGPCDGVASADAEGGYYVVAAVFDVSCDGGVVDGLVVDAGECFGLSEGDGVWGVWVYGSACHVVSFLCKNKLASFLFLFFREWPLGWNPGGFSLC